MKENSHYPPYSPEAVVDPVHEFIGNIDKMKRLKMLQSTQVGDKYLNGKKKPTKDELLDQRLNMKIELESGKLQMNEVFYRMEIRGIDTILDIYNGKF